MYEELIRCLRDCWDDSTGPSCNCDNCLFRDWIVDDGGYTDYTKCVTAMVLAAADAIEQLSKGRVCRIVEHDGVTELSVVPR